jgi:hypothetical protein
MLTYDSTKELVMQVLERNVADEPLRHLLHGMLQWDEVARITIQDVARHEYLRH